LSDALIRQAREWLAVDPDPETRDQTLELIENNDQAPLEQFFSSRLQFGTAGLRGPLGPGPGGMNRLMVRRVTRGLAAYVKSQANESPTAVVAYDGRRGSRLFADDTAAVFADQGFKVWLFDELAPTPLLASAVLAMGADIGVMVTASHNPPTDNGYKVYWSNGAQIVPPHDRGISAAIDSTFEQDFDLPKVSALRATGRIQSLPDTVRSDYRQKVLGLRVHSGQSLSIAYTPLHGVGCELLQEVFERAGHRDLHVVESQAAPDGEFPTVSFPNPEEPGAMDRVLQLADQVDADLVLAHDPDADRLAVAVPDGQGSYQVLTGDQVGILLADDLLAHGERSERRMVATTIVSSSMLRRLASHYGAAYEETLTGLKWIANSAIEFERNGGQFVFGYEEALGYCPGSAVRDKDGISAALLFADLAAWCQANSTTVLARLEAIYRQHGLYASCQRNLVLPGSDGAQRIAAMMQQLRDSRPRNLAGHKVIRIRDVLDGRVLDPASGESSRLSLPSGNVLAFDLNADCRVIARPSGTEPKIKFYIEVREAMAESEPLQASERRAKEHMDTLAEAFMGLAGAI
jgi:phosphomannomutase